MTTRLFLLLLLCAAVRAGAEDAKPAPAAAPAPTPAPAASSAVRPVATTARPNVSAVPVASFDAFRLIGERNIFNPNRTGRRDRSSEERAPRLDTITLVGTMDYDRGLLAFFDGSESAYRKTLRVGESVDQFKVTKIAADGIELEHNGKTFPMKVAQQLRRPEGGDWNMIGADIARAEAAKAAEAAQATDSSAPPSIPADASDTLRRMMEQRQKQLKQ